jgi:EAL domain-containing protein (putative c-di-GMP-specific phosphodiesterase class I)
LREALERDEFELHFQPKVCLETGELVSSEALLRWHHPERGLLSPSLFIPAAEQSQLIAPIGEWVVREACARIRAWLDAGVAAMPVSVNVSLVQLGPGDFVATVRDALDAYDIAPSYLTLEITESVFESESDSLRRQIERLHAMGVRLSLDDFGTGYSSLRYLQRYPFDEIKIDQGFVQRIDADDYSERVVRMVLDLARTLSADVVAEGVETATLRDALRAMGCRIAQGYYFSIPLEAEDFAWLLAHARALPVPAKADAAGDA